jgi:hypothetical protein
MPAQKARTILKVEYDTSASDGRNVLVTFKSPEHYGVPNYKHPLSRCSRTEIQRLAGVRILNLGLPRNPDRVTAESAIGGAMLLARSVDVDTSWQEEDTPSDSDSGSDDSEPETPEEAQSIPTPVVMSHVPKPAPAPSSLEDMIRQIASGVVGKVDMEQVRRVAEETALDTWAILGPNVTHVHLPDGATKEVPGKQHEQFPTVLKVVASGLNPYLVGPPGTGKSHMAQACATALDVSFGALSLGPTTPASRLWGYYDAEGRYVRTAFRDCYEHGGVFVLDEMDNGHAGILAEMNMALANGGASFPDGYVPKHDQFVIVACANTYGTGATAQFIGRNALDAATLDRFTMIHVDIDEDLEQHLAEAASPDHGKAWCGTVRRFRKNAERAGLKVVLSPRAVIEGAKLLQAGFSQEEVIRMRVLRGLTPEQEAKVRG